MNFFFSFFGQHSSGKIFHAFSPTWWVYVQCVLPSLGVVQMPCVYKHSSGQIFFLILLGFHGAYWFQFRFYISVSWDPGFHRAGSIWISSVTIFPPMAHSRQPASMPWPCATGSFLFPVYNPKIPPLLRLMQKARSQQASKGLGIALYPSIAQSFNIDFYGVDLLPGLTPLPSPTYVSCSDSLFDSGKWFLSFAFHSVVYF